jgi:hypothetical protein
MGVRADSTRALRVRLGVDRARPVWWQEAEANDVLPLDDRTLVDIIMFRQPNGLMSQREVTLHPGQGHVPQLSMITSTERSMEITAYSTASDRSFQRHPTACSTNIRPVGGIGLRQGLHG